MNPHHNPNDPNAFLLPAKDRAGVVQPVPSDDTDDQSNDSTTSSANPAADVIRQKLNNLYGLEPDAQQEAKELTTLGRPRSKYQAYMYQLTTSGQSLAEIQTAWHNYYVGLPDTEKHQVWQEFYSAHAASTQHQHAAGTSRQSTPEVQAQPQQAITAPASPAPLNDTRTSSDIKKMLLERISGRGKLKAKHHVQSLAFGLASGGLVVLLLLFSFFNERFIAPFITPSRTVSAASIIIDPNNPVAPNANPEVIIPKINVEIPVVYSQPSIDENAIEQSLENGVVHYATTPNPGQLGNAVIFGHSSNNILNKGHYKFAFVLLSRLEAGDLFYLTKDGKRYAYKVYDKRIVKPTDVSVLGDTGKPATATLITCDPPGTSINRLIVIGEQISPDPTANTASTALKSSAKPAILPSNSPSLWQHIKNWFTN